MITRGLMEVVQSPDGICVDWYLADFEEFRDKRTGNLWLLALVVVV